MRHLFSGLRPAVSRALTALAVVGLGLLAYRAYAWPGVALAAGGVVMWVLLNMTRMMVVLKRTARQPVGSVGSAVMMHARLEHGQTLLQLLALAGSLGQRVDGMPSSSGVREQYRWTDGSLATVLCTLEHGKLVDWELLRG